MAGNDGVCCDGGGGNGVGGWERNCWAGFNGSWGPDAKGPLANECECACECDGGGGNGCDGVNDSDGFCLNSFGSRTYNRQKSTKKENLFRI